MVRERAVLGASGAFSSSLDGRISERDSRIGADVEERTVLLVRRPFFPADFAEISFKPKDSRRGFKDFLFFELFFGEFSIIN